MTIVLWVLQALVALAFLIHAAGMLKPPAQVQPGMSYIHDLPAGLRRYIGVIEILGAIGLILPPLVNVLPILAPLAAAGLVIVMVLAIAYHIRRRENPNIGLNLVLAVLALVVAYGRFVLVPF